jgi:hypothetical protein
VLHSRTCQVLRQAWQRCCATLRRQLLILQKNAQGVPYCASGGGRRVGGGRVLGRHNVPVQSKVDSSRQAPHRSGGFETNWPSKEG